MKKLLAYIMVGTALTITGCDSLELSPVSSISDNKYWKEDAQFSAFNIGLHTQFRERSYNYFILGETRADYFAGETAFGSATQGNELLWYNTINEINTGISNFANLYGVINQINLMIAKAEANTTLTAEARKSYLGSGYGMRAYLYFHLLRSWGNVVLWTEYTEGSSLDLSNLGKAASPAADIMAQIIDDISKSETAYGTNYNFRNGNQRYFWSKAATMMIKAEAYLWRGKQMGGGASDYNIAKSALLEIQGTGKFQLLPLFKNIFAYENKNNNEIIFTIRNARDEYVAWDGQLSHQMWPQQNILFGYYNENGIPIKDLGAETQITGVIRFPVNKQFYEKGFHDADTRKRSTLQATYAKDATTGALTYNDSYVCKFIGTLLDGASTRTVLDDYPIYRYADCLLLLAQAKAFLGEDPATEINEVRKRAYGETYFEANKATVAYPNDNNPALYADNASQTPDNAGAIEAVLKERMREFMLEGKRWYDLRLAGWEYVKAHTAATESRLLWPIDASTLTNNNELTQTPGYTKEK